MYEDYRKAYLHHREIYGADTAIFYLVGKFYELYDCAVEPCTPIRRITELLDIQLSVRKGDYPNGQDALFAGVPEQSLHKYASRLTGKGWTVVVYTQVKDTDGNVTERTVARIITCGTHVESVANSADSFVLAGIWLAPKPWGQPEPPSFGLAALDLTTAAITTYESTAVGKRDSWTADDAFHFFQIHAPREVIVFWRGQEVDRPSEEALRRQFGLLSAKLMIVRADCAAQGGLEKAEVREDLLRRAISAKGLLPIRELVNGPSTERVLCALIHYVQEIFPSAPRRLHVPEAWSPASSLYLGNHALIQLNMITPRLQDSILGLFSKTKTPMGQRAMRKRILHPIADASRLNTYYNELDAFGECHDLDSIEHLLAQIADLPRLHRRIVTADVTATDVLYLDQSYRCAERIAKQLAGTPNAAPASLDFAALHAVFAAPFSVEKAKEASENASFLQDTAAPDVCRQERTICETYTAMNTAVEAIAVWAGVPVGSLRLEFRETMGPVVQAPKAIMKIVIEKLRNARSTPPYSGIKVQEKKSSAGLEIPHLDALFRTILTTRVELTAAVRTALPPLCDTLSATASTLWDTLEDWISRVDVTVTLWSVGQELGFVRPLLVSGAAGASVTLEGLRHPLIEATSNRAEYVRHSVTLDAKGCGWLVYGMNASGKSSLMKAVGIAVVLAQAGCYVPASRMTLVPFRGLYTRILNTDNLWAGLSSFAVEMTELREILARADTHSLVLGDELCSGTESQSATALVGAGIRWLHDR
jgi:DNA mismatch repair protein MutS